MSERDKKEYPPVEPTGVCRYFERVSSSLIEEPEVCELCVCYIDGRCHRAQSPS